VLGSVRKNIYFFNIPNKRMTCESYMTSGSNGQHMLVNGVKSFLSIQPKIKLKYTHSSQPNIKMMIKT